MVVKFLGQSVSTVHSGRESHAKLAIQEHNTYIISSLSDVGE